ncbi:hypothetical protein CEXT_197121 [Caerostris extrusa]|uniref:Uncharacterized protein n=1 Tax=Caerostris extrusa TaxID=172846 RepID=A0AAV4QW33_CAEEX|nr:hypothetical protein CEXT_197121 [Caerostris extrusa]
MPHRYLVLRIPYSRYTSCYTSSNSRYTPSVSHPPNSQYTSSISRCTSSLQRYTSCYTSSNSRYTPSVSHPLIASIRLQYLVVRPPYSGIQLLYVLLLMVNVIDISCLITSMPHRYLVLRIPYSRYTSCYTSSNSRYTPSVSHPPNSQYTSSISRCTSSLQRYTTYYTSFY